MDLPTNNIDLNNRRKKKFTGGNASKRHRDRVNVEFNNLAQLLPFPESVIAKLDKSSILRLAVSYIRAKSFFKGASILRRETLSSLIKEGTGAVTEIFSKALEGFLLVLTEDMKVLFVSESVRDYLGYCQAGIIHENFLQFVNPLDHCVAQQNVNYQQTEASTCSDQTDAINENESHGSPPPPVARRFVCRMKCAFSCSSRFYTAYRSFQFSGHLRKSSIQEGRQEKTVNTLVVFANPLNNSENNTTASVPRKKEKEARSSSSFRKEMNTYDTYTSGFRIEPTLRPHVTPILVTSQEHSDICASNEMTAVDGSSPAEAVKVEEIPSKPPPDLPPLIKSERYSPLFLSKNIYRDSAATEQFYSDQSDDSKFSPVSSPDLLWKQKLYNDERYLPFSKSSDRDAYWLKVERRLHEEQSFMHPSVLEVARRESRLELPRRETRSTSPRINHHYAPLEVYPSQRKRHFIDTSDNFVYKRKKLEVGAFQRSNKFDINSLLGLDDTASHNTSYKNKPY
eukprot:TCONS_00066077-protein